MTTRADLQAALAIPNVLAFLRVIRAGESNQDDSAYTLINGGGHFTSFADHPYAGQSAPPGKAAGAYQFIPHTWQSLVVQYGFPDFGPQSQNEGAVALIIEKGALASIQAGYVSEACNLLKSTWISLPPGGIDNAEKVFVQYGGAMPETTTITQPQPAPVQSTAPQLTTASTPVSQPQLQGTSMGALAFIPLIGQLIPALAPVIDLITGATTAKGAAGGTLHATDYAALAQTIVDTFTKAVPAAPNTATAIGMAQADPAVQAAAAQAVLAHPDVAAQLAALQPVLDQVHGFDKDEWAAKIAGRAAASAVALQDKYDIAPVMVQNVTQMSWGALGGMALGVIAAVVAKALVPTLPDYASMIIPAITLVIGQLMKERSTIISYRFDGTPTSNATAMASTQIASMNAVNATK